MKVVRSPGLLACRPRAVAIGMFDGLHRGHQAVVGAVLGTELVPTVVTFDPHPRETLGYGVELLTTLERRLELLAALGIEEVLVVEFTQEVAALSPERFAEAAILAAGAEVVVAGAGFRFGAGRSGDLETFERLGAATREVALVPGVSSTEIRRLAAEGDVRGAAAMLGRPHEVRGTVERGDARGRELGFPTANVGVPANICLPVDGVYAGTFEGADGVSRPAAISAGRRPTFYAEAGMFLVEAYVLDFAGDLYGQQARVRFTHRLRGQERFDSVDDLIAQMGRDVERVRVLSRA